MALSHTERWILSNQFRILQLLDKDEAEYYAKAKEAIDSGYELEYACLSQYIDSDVTTVAECLEVLDMLSMFQYLKWGYDDLPDKSGIEEWRVKFAGFDGNNEVKQMAYAKYVCNLDDSRFATLESGDNFNSHCPVLDRYRAMLSEWNRSGNKYKLSKDDIIRIIEAV